MTYPLQVKRFSTPDGVTLAGDVGGDPKAPPVILMHGGGQTRHAWGAAASVLANSGFYVVSLDLRGHGDSDWSPDGSYHIDNYVRDLYAVLATLSQPAALVGASLGGVTSLIAAGEAKKPIVSAIVLVDIVPMIDPEGSRKISGFMHSNKDTGFATVEEAAEVVADYLPHRPRPKDVSGLMKNLRRGEDGRLYWHWDPAFISGHGNLGGSMSQTRMEEAARNLRIPVLLVRGRMSEIVSEEGVKQFLKIVPSAEYIDVADAGHMVAGDKNDAFNEAVISFLKKVVRNKANA